jgi:hypothetical protein
MMSGAADLFPNKLSRGRDRAGQKINDVTSKNPQNLSLSLGGLTCERDFILVGGAAVKKVGSSHFWSKGVTEASLCALTLI